MCDNTLMSSGGPCFNHNFIAPQVSFTDPNVLIRQERAYEERSELPRFRSFQKDKRVQRGSQILPSISLLPFSSVPAPDDR
jgi:hypothetical protein